MKINLKALFMLQTINTSLAFLDTLDLINFCLKMYICSYLFVHVTDAMYKDKKGVGVNQQ